MTQPLTRLRHPLPASRGEGHSIDWLFNRGVPQADEGCVISSAAEREESGRGFADAPPPRFLAVFAARNDTVSLSGAASRIRSSRVTRTKCRRPRFLFNGTGIRTTRWRALPARAGVLPPSISSGPPTCSHATRIGALAARNDIVSGGHSWRRARGEASSRAPGRHRFPRSA